MFRPAGSASPFRMLPARAARRHPEIAVRKRRAASYAWAGTALQEAPVVDCQERGIILDRLLSMSLPVCGGCVRHGSETAQECARPPFLVEARGSVSRAEIFQRIVSHRPKTPAVGERKVEREKKDLRALGVPSGRRSKSGSNDGGVRVSRFKLGQRARTPAPRCSGAYAPAPDAHATAGAPNGGARIGLI